jgi:hypothetical protein
MAGLKVFISDTSDFKKILVYLSDINHPNIRVLYSAETRFDDGTKRILNNNRTAENVSRAPIEDECCIEWDKDTHKIGYDVPTDVSHAIRKIGNEPACYVLGANAVKRIFFFDARHKPDLPKEFIHIHQITNLGELKKELRSCGIEPFSLKDTSLFTHHKEECYKCNDTGHYWYMDKFHKNHYEVFDSTGKHLGEASMQGILDADKADNKKRLENI